MTKASKFLVFAILFLAAKAVAETNLKSVPRSSNYSRHKGQIIGWITRQRRSRSKSRVMLTTLN
jgi:hypothetical protein